MKSRTTSTLIAGAALAALGLAPAALGAPAADGMPRDLIAEGQAVQTASDADDKEARQERETYLEETGRKLDETGEEIAESDFGQDVQDAWDEVQVQWDRLTAATAETWDEAQTSFEESWEDFEEQWQAATDDNS